MFSTKAKHERMRDEFNSLYETIETTIKYKDSWNNGTGYLNGVMDEEVEGVAKFITDAPDSRRGIIVNVDGKHKICLFERYTPNTRSPFVLVSHHDFEPLTRMHKLISGIYHGNILESERAFWSFANMASMGGI